MSLLHINTNKLRLSCWRQIALTNEHTHTHTHTHTNTHTTTHTQHHTTHTHTHPPTTTHTKHTHYVLVFSIKIYKSLTLPFVSPNNQMKENPYQATYEIVLLQCH